MQCPATPQRARSACARAWRQRVPALVRREDGVVLLALEVVGPDRAVTPVEEARGQNRPVRRAGQHAVDAGLPAMTGTRSKRTTMRERMAMGKGNRVCGFWGFTGGAKKSSY